MTEEDKEDDFMFAISSAEAIRPPYPYMEKLTKVSSVINMWPKSKTANSFLYHTRIWTTVFVCITVILTFGVKIIKEFRSMDSVTALIDFITVFISAVFRYIYVYVRGDKHLDLVALIHGNFIHCPIIPNKRALSLDKQYKFANKLILTYCTFTLFWVFQICTFPIIGYVWGIVNLPPHSNETVPYPMPYDVYTPFEYQKQPGLVIAAFYIYQSAGYMIIGSIYVLVDSFWYMVVMLTIGQFILIQDSLKTITEALRKAEERGHVLKEEQIHKVEQGLKRCIVHHQFLKRFVRLIDNLSNPVILVDYMHAVTSIAFILLHLTISLNNRAWNKVMYPLQYFITSITHMFFFDWLGNELAEKEEELANVIYDFPWYKFPSQKTTLLLMSAQARKPFKLTGGKMFKLSLQFFAKTSKAVFSYFTFLFQMRNERRN